MFVFCIRSWPNEKTGRGVDVPRPEPEGGINYPAVQYPVLPQVEDEDEESDEMTGLLKHDVAVADVGIQPSMTWIAPESLLPANEETLQQPLISVGPGDFVVPATVHTALSPSQSSVVGEYPAYDEPATPDVDVRPSSTRIISDDRSRRRVSTTEDSYAGSGRERSYPLTKTAILRSQQNWLQQQEMDASAAEDRRRVLGDSGDRYRAVGESVSPESIATLSPGRSSTITLLYDTESSDSDVDVVRTKTRRAIANMKRERLRKLSPEPAISQPEKVRSPMSVRAPSGRSRTPQAVTRVDGTTTGPSIPAVPDVPSVPSSSTPVPPSDRIVEVQPESDLAPLGRTPTPAVHVLRDRPAVFDTLPAPVTQSAGLVVPVKSMKDKLKDMQKTERTDAEGRKRMVYKLTPKAGARIPSPMLQAFATAPVLRATSLGDHAASGDQARPLPSASIKLVGEDRDVPTSAGAGFSWIGRPTDADKQNVSRLKTLADHRGENMSQLVLQEIQGTSAKPQVRSAGLAQVSALREPFARTAGEDQAVSIQDKLWSSAQGRLTYAPVTAEKPQAAVVEYHHEPELDEPLDVSNSLSNFPDVSGERFHAELPQRLSFGVPVPDATNDANLATSQFLQDRFDSEKMCFRGLSEDYLKGVRYEDLQPETRSLLNRMSNVGKTREEIRQASTLQKIRSSLSVPLSDQRLSQARPDYSQQPSSTKLGQASRRLSFLPADAAHPDESLHPSFTKVAQKQTAEDMSKSDEFLHPSLHRMTLTPDVVAARPDDALHSSETKLSLIANYDEAEHPSLTTLHSKGISQMSQIPVKSDDYLHPSLTRVQHRGKLLTELGTTTDIPAKPDDALHPSETKLIPAANRFAKYDEAQHPSMARLQSKGISQASQIPAKSDDYLHPSLTRVQHKFLDSDKLRTDHETTTDIPARPDDALHLSETKLIPAASHVAKYDEAQHPSLTRLQTRGVPAKSDGYLHPSVTRVQHESLDSGKLRTQLETTTDIPARPDDPLHSSDTKRIPAASHIAKYDDAQHPSLTRLQSPGMQIPAKSDGYVRPLLTRVQHKSLESAKLHTDLETTTTTTSAMDREYFLFDEPARPDDILHPSATRVVSDDSTTRSQFTRRDTVAASHIAKYDEAQHPSVTRLQTRGISQTSQIPVKPDDYFRPSLTRVQHRGILGTDLETTTGIPARPDDALHPSETKLIPAASHITKHDEAQHPSVARLQSRSIFQASQIPSKSDDSLHPSLTRVQHKSLDSGKLRTDLGTTMTTTSAVDQEYFVFDEPARPDNILHPSSTRVVSDDSTARSRLTRRDTGTRELLTLVPATPDYISYPSSTRLTTRDQAERPGAVASLDRKETLRSVPARTDDILHPASTRFPARVSARGSAAATAAADGRKETSSSVHARPDDATVRAHSSQFPTHDSTQARAAFDAANSTTTLRQKETVPSLPAGPDNILHPTSTQVAAREGVFSQRDSARATLDALTSTAVLGRKETTQSVSARQSDPIHFSARGSAAATLDSATTIPDRKESLSLSTRTQFPSRDSVQSTTASVGKKETLPSVATRPDSVTYQSSESLPRESSRAQTTLDSATATTALSRTETLPSIPAVPGDLKRPSSTQFRQRESARSTIDSTTMTRGEKIPSRPDDILHPSLADFPEDDRTRRTSDREAGPDSRATGYDRWQTLQSEEWMKDVAPSTDEMHAAPSSLRQRSDRQPSADKYEGSSLTGPEVSYPSEFLHPSLTVVGTERAISDSGVRPSVRIADQDKLGRASVSDSRPIVDSVRQDDVRSTTVEAAEDERIMPDRHPEEMQSGRTGVRRSSIMSVSHQRQMVPSAPKPAPETPKIVDWKRLRQKVTWDLGPRAKSDMEARPDSVSSSGQLSLPNILDAGGSPGSWTSATRASSAVTTDWSHRGASSAEWSDEPLANIIDARDSRDVTREHITRKKRQEESARSDEHPRTTSERVRRRDSAADAVEDERTPYVRGSLTTPGYQSSSERAGETRVVGESASADDISVHTEDESSSSVADFHRIAESEDSLLECPSASLSRPPCRCWTVVDRTHLVSSSASSSADVCGEICRHVCAVVSEQRTRTTCRCSSSSSLSNSGFDVTRSTTYHDVAACVRGRRAARHAPSTTTHAADTTPMSRVDCHRDPPDAGRTCWSRQADSAAADSITYGRDPCRTDVAVHQGPFARGYVPPAYRSQRSTYGPSSQPCQSTRQPAAQQVCVSSLSASQPITRLSYLRVAHSASMSVLLFPSFCPAEMYAGRVTCCPLVSQR